MPYKDLEVRREKQRGYGRTNYQRVKSRRDSTVCSTCGKARDDERFKKCSKCREYMKQYKAVHRATGKDPGVCTASDCVNLASDGFKLCSRCREQRRESEKQPHRKVVKDQWLKTLKPAAFFAYGGKCVCCGEAQEKLLSIDHIDGYMLGPRKGNHLYSWLKQHNYPPGFRVLCMTCNFTLGHHGYCPHSTLIQVNRTGRPRTHSLTVTSQIDKERKRVYFQDLKRTVLEQYGGVRCVCCGESHMECLSVDHIDGKGAEHRNGDKGARNLYVWLRANRYPTGYRVLCHGCNFAIGHFGSCPHSGTMPESEEI